MTASLAQTIRLLTKQRRWAATARHIAAVVWLCAGVAGCTTSDAPKTATPENAPPPLAEDTSDPAVSRTSLLWADLPPLRRFTQTQVTPPARSNTEMARDFLDLFFQFESGTPVAALSRFDAPVDVQVTTYPAGQALPPTLDADLAQVLRRLQREAGINITRLPATAPRKASATERGTLLINIVSGADIARALPNVACFAVPKAVDWDGFRQQQGTDALNWASLRRRTEAAIFVPGDVSPQELRNCLHEELAQALGPLNDLYRLPDSVFNDDNMHLVLTGFDMLMLRLAYHRDLANGMTRAEVAAILPGLLDRLNPAGRGGGPDLRAPIHRDWINATLRTAAMGQSHRAQRRSAQTALRIAQNAGWTDLRLGISHYFLSFFLLADPAAAIGHLRTAYQIFDSAPGTEIQRAHAAARLASYNVYANRPDMALRLLDRDIPTARRAQNAELLASMLMLRAQALDEAGRFDDARAQHLDSLGWARYGMGSDAIVRRAARDTASLNPLR